MTKKHTVLFIMPALWGGGAEKVLIDILQNFDFTKYEVSLLLEYREGVYIDRIPGDVRVISLFSKDNLWFQRAKRYSHILHCFWAFHPILFKGVLRRRLGKVQYDTIVSFMEGEAVKLHSYIFDKGARHVSWVHINLETKHWSLESFNSQKEEQRVYGKMNCIACVSEDVKKSFGVLFPDAASKAKVIYNLIDCEQIRSMALASESVVKEDAPIICAVGRLNAQKRYDRALEAVSILKKRGVDMALWIIGQGELEEDLRACALTLGVEDRVRFLGFHRNPYPFVAACDVFLNASDSEGYPLTVCEAVCLGKAIVATDITGSHEILMSTNSGLLVDKNSESIANAIEVMLKDRDRQKMFETNAESSASMFDIEKTMNQIFSVL